MSADYPVFAIICAKSRAAAVILQHITSQVCERYQHLRPLSPTVFEYIVISVYAFVASHIKIYIAIYQIQYIQQNYYAKNRKNNEFL